MALVRLRALDVQTTTDLAKLPDRVEALDKEAGPPGRRPGADARADLRISLVLEQIQRALSSAPPAPIPRPRPSSTR